jgi:hypothetical protein
MDLLQSLQKIPTLIMDQMEYIFCNERVHRPEYWHKKGKLACLEHTWAFSQARPKKARCKKGGSGP